MSIRELNKAITQCTVAYRKGEVVNERDAGPVHVVEIMAYPETPGDGQLVDMHFINIGFTEAITPFKKEPMLFINMIKDAEVGEFIPLPLERMAQGPSYIEYGQWLGSQEQALRFMAMLQYLGIGATITPETMGLSGAEADTLAGRGFVMAAYRDPTKQKSTDDEGEGST